MNKTKAVARGVRMSPRKARLAAALIRGLPVAAALNQLVFCEMKAGRLLKKTLDSAVANAEHNQDARRENLWVEEVYVDAGPTMKRSKPKNRGGRHPIMKRTSHLTVVLASY